MKTKYIKIPVIERLPEKEGKLYYIRAKDGIHHLAYIDEDNHFLISNNEVLRPFEVEYWLEEKEDHSEEMISMLEKSRKMLQSLKLSMLVHPDCEEGSEFDDYTTSAQETEDKIEELINKINNGKI
ncbi:hypothetical protein [Elizabethkingia bruuniana]|uniref:hypothetical protein n=1 Tax=Elizabethkingia bruuniana TaxID=1756149 RepID=UPI002013204E|nr:hypothetical protein [Elizabethkingia bruuniana]MCL1636288.1 hypothetical protein [Elizabethkingia bruuniana]